jgi:hypothetical protein
MNLTDENFLREAMRSYDNPHCFSLDVFKRDLKHIKYIKRLLNKYQLTGDLKERLILNHIIILSNIFGVEQATRMLFFKLGPQFYISLKTFLRYLGFLPECVHEIDGENIYTKDIPTDINIERRLNEL